MTATVTMPEVVTLADEEEIARAVAAFSTAMVGFRLPTDAAADRHEPGRTLAVLDAGEIVGTAASYTSWLAVPGGARVPHAAVTHVGVLPTHTRRGIVSAILRGQLADIADRGEVVATLRASEAVIYERFGYGIANRTATLELDRRRARLRDTVGGDGPVRLVDPAAAHLVRRTIYADAAWPGAIDRTPYWWNLQAIFAAHAPGPAHLVVHGAPGAEDGYALYHPVDGAAWWESRHRTVVVDDLVAHSDAAYVGLIRHLATLDPLDTIRFAARPVDDPLAELLVDARAVRVTDVRDETWLRLVDVEAALAARAYGPAGPLVIAVEDALLPGNTGNYRVEPGGVVRTDRAPDLSVDVAALASAYLGGTRWSALALAGRVVEHRPSAVQAADALFATAVAPFSGTGF
jgi:predicted acetyltransferase